MSTVFDTFFPRPDSIVISTTSYTIPEGFFARVLARTSGAGTVTLNGVTVLSTIAKHAAAAAVATGTTALNYTVPADYVLRGGRVWVSTNNTTFTVAGGQGFNVSPGDTVELPECQTGTVISSNAPSASKILRGLLYAIIPTESEGQFNLKEGDILSGTGTRTYVIELYKNPLGV